jgi:MFS superfamily sulfate permease-like transporter
LCFDTKKKKKKKKKICCNNQMTIPFYRQMSVGPEATLSLLVGSSIAQLNQGDEDSHVDPLAWACLMTIFVGIFTFLLGIFRLGFLDSLMSRALLRGFISGLGLVVALQQGIILLGLAKLSEHNGITEASSSIARFLFLIKNFQHSHVLTASVSAASVAFLTMARVTKSKLTKFRWFQLLPEVLLVVIASSLLTYFFDWENKGLAILGTIEGKGIPLPSIPAFPESKHMKDMLITAAMIAIIGFVESVVIAKTYSTKHNYSVSANRELVALGVANIASGVFQGIPAFGSVSISI